MYPSPNVSIHRRRDEFGKGYECDGYPILGSGRDGVVGGEVPGRVEKRRTPRDLYCVKRWRQ